MTLAGLYSDICSEIRALLSESGAVNILPNTQQGADVIVRSSRKNRVTESTTSDKSSNEVQSGLKFVESIKRDSSNVWKVSLLKTKVYEALFNTTESATYFDHLNCMAIIHVHLNASDDRNIADIENLRSLYLARHVTELMKCLRLDCEHLTVTAVVFLMSDLM